jgi:glycosyltransferase involved in cell wall biosynthesis
MKKTRNNPPKQSIFYACFEDLSREVAWTVHIREVINQWEKMGVSVTLFAPKIWPFGTPPRCRIVYVPTIPLRFLREYCYLFLLPFYILFHGIKEKPRALYCREMSFMLFCALSTYLLKIPLIVEINGFIVEELKLSGVSLAKRTLFRLFQRMNFMVSSALVMVTEELISLFKKEYNLTGKKIYCVPNGVDTDVFSPGNRKDAQERLGLDTQNDYITFIGSFYPHAETTKIIDVAKHVLTRCDSVKFIMIGDGHERKKCEALARGLNISSGVDFLGTKPYDMIPDYIRASSLLLNLRSFYTEGSMKMLEYMSCGGAVVSNLKKIYGIPLNDGVSYFAVTQKDPKHIADILLSLLADKKLTDKIKREARRLILENFSWEKTAKQLLAVIDDALREHKKIKG